MYKAPKSKRQPGEYYWLCLDHIREYNSAWDFFKDMSAQEIEAFRHDAVTGHRPTWRRETNRREPVTELYDALYEFLAMPHKKPSKAIPPISAKLRKALAVLDMDYPYSLAELKRQYRAMVKKYHPDVNKGDKRAEETFKKITESYHLLATHSEAGI